MADSRVHEEPIASHLRGTSNNCYYRPLALAPGTPPEATDPNLVKRVVRSTPIFLVLLRTQCSGPAPHKTEFLGVYYNWIML